ncbi:FAD-binding protein [Endozoicomonadaceae bacterium StTr2]
MARSGSRYQSWGRYPKSEQTAEVAWNAADIGIGIAKLRGEGFLPFGNGCSYGDSCLAASGQLLDFGSLDSLISFDPATGKLVARPGARLGDISRIAMATGWGLPVTPGTSRVTLGGAVANDVHGKNHLKEGSFGHHISGLQLLRSNGEVIECSPEENTDWLYHTIGGLGLTGTITKIELALKRTPGPWLDVEPTRMEQLADYFALEQETGNEWEHRVAWIDCLAPKNSLGRGWYIRARSIADQRPVSSRINIPAPALPFSPLNSLTLKLFNNTIFHLGYRRGNSYRQDYMRFFYPLDSVSGWNRLYGPAGFQQYQCMVPNGDAEDVISELLSLIAAAGQGSFLAVLKRFGSRHAAGALSFPREGYTLALDFPNRQGLAELFQKMDDCVQAAGGALYPAKDAHMSPDFFRMAYPAWEQHEAMRDPAINSCFWQRMMDDI